MNIRVIWDGERDEEDDSELTKSRRLKAIRRGYHIAIPGEIISPESGFLRGHGTHVIEGNIVATVAGVVERVNKLISVRPLRTRYMGHIGDVVVGRVTEVGNKKWKIDVQGRQDAILQLSAINLPGGEHRRRTEEDRLRMRKFYCEDDLISAEVQQFFQDGSMALQTRSLRYGKLEGGMLIDVCPSLVKRCKQHFHTFPPPCSVSMILGMNGYIWLQEAVEKDDELERDVNAPASIPRVNIPMSTRLNMCRIANSIRALDRLFLPISVRTIEITYEEGRHLHAKEMLNPDVMKEITAKVAKEGSVAGSDFT